MNATAAKSPGRRAALSTAIKASLLRWLGVPVQLTDTEFWNEWLTASGQTVNAETALRLETVWACVGLLSETVATLPFGLFRRLSNGGKEAAVNHPLYSVLHASPNADMTTPTFLEVVMTSMLLWGNAFAEIIRVGERIIALDFILPQRMSVHRMSDGSIEYRWLDINRRARKCGEADMLHILGKSTDGIVGLSPLSYARHMMGNAMAVDKAAAQMFKQGLLFSGTFETEHAVPEKLREQFKKRLEEYRGSINAGKAPLLEAGIKYHPISMNPLDAQMLETRSFSVEQICRWFRVPPFMVGHTTNSTSWGTGLEQQKIGFLTFTLLIWLTRIQRGVARKCLSPADRITYFAEFNLEGLLQADSMARGQFYSTMTQNGIYTRDNCRTKENLPALGGNAAVLTVQSNLVPLDQLGQGPTQAALVQNAMREWLGIVASDDSERTMRATATQE
jgi:HK97 family phage portal protein